jgi:hypothetical protein
MSGGETMSVNGWQDAYYEAHKKWRAEKDEADRLRAEVAGLREAAQNMADNLRWYAEIRGSHGVLLETYTALCEALTSTSTTAEAYDRRVRNKALKDSADGLKVISKLKLINVSEDYAAGWKAGLEQAESSTRSLIQEGE